MKRGCRRRSPTARRSSVTRRARLVYETTVPGQSRSRSSACRMACGRWASRRASSSRARGDSPTARPATVTWRTSESNTHSPNRTRISSMNQDSRNNPATPHPPDGRVSPRRSSLSPVALGQAAPVRSRSWVVSEDGGDVFAFRARRPRWRGSRLVLRGRSGPMPRPARPRRPFRGCGSRTIGQTPTCGAP